MTILLAVWIIGSFFSCAIHQGDGPSIALIIAPFWPLEAAFLIALEIGSMVRSLFKKA